MMVIKLEKNRKVVKSWEFDEVDETFISSILEMIDAEYSLIRKLRKKKGTAGVEV